MLKLLEGFRDVLEGLAILLSGVEKLKLFEHETNLSVLGKDLPKTMSMLIEKEALQIMSPEDALKISNAILRIIEISQELERTNISTATLEDLKNLVQTARSAAEAIDTVLRRLTV